MLARADLDFTLRAERANAPRRLAQNRATRALSWVMRPALLRSLALAGFLAFVAMVSINALLLQKSRHPAPLLGATSPAHPAPAAKAETTQTPPPAQTPPEAHGGPASVAGNGAVSAMPPLPATVPVVVQNAAPAQSGAGVAPPIVALPMAPPPMVPPPRPRTPATVNDPIARLLGADPIGSGLEPNKTVLMAQRALLKVGYVVRPDGMMGATTRRVLEQFERDRGLPVKGELSVRVRRELSVLSGLPVE
jgi:hypothetical protein